MDLINYNYNKLTTIRTEIKAGICQRQPAYKKLRQEADELLNTPPASVTEGELPPSGDNHDFFAIGKYAWPNPDTPNGMPWIRRDCEVNPDAYGDKYDYDRYNKTIDNINTLSAAWFYSEDEKYAQKASELIRVWFLDEETKMNPNFECASALPGVFNGMAIGVIFGVRMIEMLDYIKLLKTSACWTSLDEKSLKNWVSDYCAWLLESEFGKKEAIAMDNHGSWYAAQVATFSIYSGDLGRVRSMVDLAKKQIGEQIAKDGSLPAETKRKWSFHYSLFGLSAFVVLARCAECIGEDLWNYRAPNGHNLKTACEFLVPRVSGQKKWEYPNVDADESVAPNVFPTLRRVAEAYNIPDFRETVKILAHKAPLDSIDAWLMD